MEVLKLLHDNIVQRRRQIKKIKAMKEELNVSLKQHKIMLRAVTKYIIRSEDVCTICDEKYEVNKVELLPCSHIICRQCLKKILETATLNKSCPYCAQSILIDDWDTDDEDDEEDEINIILHSIDMLDQG